MAEPGGHIRGNQRQSEAIRWQSEGTSEAITEAIEALREVLRSTHLGETLCEGLLFRLFGGQLGMTVELHPQCPPVPPPTEAEGEPRLSHRVQDVAGPLARLSLEGHLLIPGRREGADSCSNEWPSV
jgi:hypothetical protein